MAKIFYPRGQASKSFLHNLQAILQRHLCVGRPVSTGETNLRRVSVAIRIENVEGFKKQTVTQIKILRDHTQKQIREMLLGS